MTGDVLLINVIAPLIVLIAIIIAVIYTELKYRIDKKRTRKEREFYDEAN